MPLPETIRVKLSSEAAEAIAITPVVVRQMALRELIGEMLALMGKDQERICATLRRGSFVSGGTRFRWEAQDADGAEVAALLAGFPDADPGRPFDRDRCLRVVLRARRQSLDLPRAAATGHRLFRRRSFWDVLMELAAAGTPLYLDYSYRDHADRFRLEIAGEAARRLRDSSNLMKYPTLARQLRSLAVESIEFLVERR